jgi:hypothetical protein
LTVPFKNPQRLIRADAGVSAFAVYIMQPSQWQWVFGFDLADVSSTKKGMQRCLDGKRDERSVKTDKGGIWAAAV